MNSIILGSEASEAILGILGVIWFILCLILFFKIWGMTNDVRALKKDHFKEMEFEYTDDKVVYLRKNLVLGNIENVKRMLLQHFIDTIEFAYSQKQTYGLIIDEKGNQTMGSLEEINLKDSILPYKEKLQEQFDRIGEKLPLCVQRMNTFADYYTLFLKDDMYIKVIDEEEKKAEEGKQE